MVKLIMTCSIYLSKDELHGAAKAYLKEYHCEFYNGFSEIRWTSYYTTNVLPIVSFFFLMSTVDI
jgi:hypothetical protein